MSVSLLCGEIGEVRTWTSQDGRTLEGKLLEVSSEEIVIQRNGRSLPVKVELLSEPDQALVAELLQEKELLEADKVRAEGFREGKYAKVVQGEWVEGGPEFGLLHQLYIGKEVRKKKAGPVVPLFVHLHGAAGRSDQIAVGKVPIAGQMVTRPELYERHPCVVLIPTCPPDPVHWGKEEIQTKLESLIDDLVAHLPIDRKRIYLSGYSMGGRGIWKLITRRPEFYAGAIFADGAPDLKWADRVKAPMYSYYSKDRDSSNAVALQEAYKEAGVEFRFQILPEADHNGIHWKMAKDSGVWGWLFKQRRE